MTRTNGTIALAIAALLLVAPIAARAAAPADSIPGYRSPSKAVLISTVGTLAPIAAGVGIVVAQPKYSDDASVIVAALLIQGGYLLGPATGHLYAGRRGRAWAGIGLRTLATVGLGAAVGATWNGENSGGEAIAIAATGVGVFSLVYDIARAGHSARLTNEELKTHATLAPTVVSSAPGVALTVAF